MRSGRHELQARVTASLYPTIEKITETMSSFEQPFIKAIEDGTIEGVLIEGRSKSGKSYSRVLGSRTLLDGTKKPLSSSDLLFLASATKLLTTIAVLQCCQRNGLPLKSDVTPHLPKVTKTNVLTNWDDDKSQGSFEPAERRVTLCQLLTHTSGLAYDFTVPKLRAWRAANPVAEGATGVEARFSTPLIFQPGQGWMYGTGLDWVGLIVEQVANMKLDQYFRQFIFYPLGYADTDIAFFPVREGLGHRMVDLNPKDTKGEGLSAAMGNSLHDQTPGHCYGGGGAYGTIKAYVAVLSSLLLNDGKLLNPFTVSCLMFKPQLEPRAKVSLAKTLQGEWGPYFDMGTTGKNPDFGLGGLLVLEDGDGSGLGKGTLTWGGGVNTAWFVDPTNEIAGFMSLQLGIPADAEKGLELKALFRKGLKEVLA